MKVAILGDWFDTLKTLRCYRILAGRQVAIFTDHGEDEDVLATRLCDVEALGLIRERTAIGASLLERLPNLRLIILRSVYPPSILPRARVAAWSSLQVSMRARPRTPPSVREIAELTWGLLLASARQIPAQMAALRAGQCQTGVGETLRGKTIGIYGYGRIGAVVGGYARAFGMVVVIWAREASRARDRGRICGGR